MVVLFTVMANSDFVYRNLYRRFLVVCLVILLESPVDGRRYSFSELNDLCIRISPFFDLSSVTMH